MYRIIISFLWQVFPCYNLKAPHSGIKSHHSAIVAQYLSSCGKFFFLLLYGIAFHLHILKHYPGLFGSKGNFNPLTPVPAVTSHDEPWPFFHFCRHHFWPKLVSSILNFSGRNRSLQWYQDQSDRPNEAEDMHKNAQKVEWEIQSKISCHYTWLFHVKNCHLDDAFFFLSCKLVSEAQ